MLSLVCADLTSQFCCRYSHKEARNECLEIVKESATINKCRLALVIATLIRLSSARKPTSPDKKTAKHNRSTFHII